MMERLELTLGLLRSLTVHIPLLLQMTDLTSALDELDDALVADKEEHDQKEQQRHHVLAPFAYLNRAPKLRKRHLFHHFLQIPLQSYDFFCKFPNFFVTLCRKLKQRQ